MAGIISNEPTQEIQNNDFMDLMGGGGELTSQQSTEIPVSNGNIEPSTQASGGGGLLDFDLMGGGLGGGNTNIAQANNVNHNNGGNGKILNLFFW